MRWKLGWDVELRGVKEENRKLDRSFGRQDKKETWDLSEEGNTSRLHSGHSNKRGDGTQTERQERCAILATQASHFHPGDEYIQSLCLHWQVTAKKLARRSKTPVTLFYFIKVVGSIKPPRQSLSKFLVLVRLWEAVAWLTVGPFLADTGAASARMNALCAFWGTQVGHKQWFWKAHWISLSRHSSELFGVWHIVFSPPWASRAPENPKYYLEFSPI